MIFKDRRQAGQLLAKTLVEYDKMPNAIILALPRGGLPIADEIQKVLQIPLDICLVRKLGAPGHKELAIGAIAMDNVCVLNQNIINSLGVTKPQIEHIIKIEQEELTRRNILYRKGRPAPQVKNKSVILVDDGLATGATMQAAINAVKAMGAKEIVVAIPVSAADTYQEIKVKINKIICLQVEELFFAVAQWYEDFPQVTDDEVIKILTEK